MIDSKKNDQLIISVDTLYKNFGKVEVLTGISCEIKKGEIISKFPSKTPFREINSKVFTIEKAFLFEFSCLYGNKIAFFLLA